ncbi:DNA phosphorothioation-dependent restriction protein DptF [Neptuniibacter sp. SY11_33]|uniref:DNA phosphorothioation-dependent restriction protein DptF n=1 Tax=Neptuniibacter sp. SY11_33 TaxID=3398215 RepID=UPI0039F616F0
MTHGISFLEGLSVLSKSSPYAVSTEAVQETGSIYQQIKDQLYIEMPIEQKVLSTIQSLQPQNKKIIFLCGSSGDGKSEILTRCKRLLNSEIKFHLDATHSFAPNENAIQTLDRVFEDYQRGNTPLVLGINTGMLGNYAEGGSNTVIQSNIKKYLQNNSYDDEFVFINFEDYPKFVIDDEGFRADFPAKILKRLTKSEGNLLRDIFEEDKKRSTDSKNRILFANYELLSIPEVQKVILKLLFKVRLVRDQFITARALLDFLFGLVAGPKYLFDNLFLGFDNELAEKIVDFDPANFRTQEIDRFILAYSLGLTGPDFQNFEKSLSSLGIDKLSDSHSFLRLFYVFKEYDVSNNYHFNFSDDFSEPLIDQYVECYQLHMSYSGDKVDRKKLQGFYKKTIVEAVRKYINRNVRVVGKDQFLISSVNGYEVFSTLDIQPNLEEIKTESFKSNSYFHAFITVNEEKIRPFPININLLGLMKGIIEGYRPNRHDKNSVVLLDELAADLIKVANKSHELQMNAGQRKFELKRIDDEDIEVSEVESA